MPPISRRKFITRTASAIAGGSLLSACGESSKNVSGKKQLNILSWADYLPPTTIQQFESRYGIKVIYDTFASNEALVARLEAGAVDYDVVVPTNYAVSKLKQLHLLKPIDKEKVPNLKNLMGRFAQMSFDPGNKYSVPYTFGTTGIAYNVSEFTKHGVAAPDTWEIFFDRRLGGRMTLLEDARETIGFVLKKLGYSYNTIDQKQINEATAVLMRQKPLTMCYTSDQVIIYLASGDSLLSLSFSGDAHQARRNNKEIEYVIPKDGASMWIDNMCIPASAPHEDNALCWINFILEPEISAALTNFTYYPTANQAALKYIDKAMVEDTTLFPSPAILDRCEEIKDIGNGIFLYDRAWTELKCV